MGHALFPKVVSFGGEVNVLEDRFAAFQSAARETPPESLPALLAALAAAQSIVASRLAAPRPVAVPARPRPAARLDASAAAALAGLPRERLLRLTRGLPFRHDLSRKSVVFDRDGLEAWIVARRGRLAA